MDKKELKVKGFKTKVCCNCGNVQRGYDERLCKVCSKGNWREAVFDER